MDLFFFSYSIPDERAARSFCPFWPGRLGSRAVVCAKPWGEEGAS